MTETARFTEYVHVADENAAFHVFSPGDPLPDWARPLVGDHVLSYGEFSRPVEPEAEPELVAHAHGFDEFTDEPERPPMPPTSGPGSSNDAWVRYSHALGETEPTLKWPRQKIIDLLIRKGLIVE